MISAVETLERDFAARHGFAGAVAAGFGRAALRLALEAAEVRGGDVLVPDFVCSQVPEAVRRAGGTPVYVPVTRELNVAPVAFHAAITPATRAAIVVHYFGRALPSIGLLAEICRERKIALIEDCALALGCEGVGFHGSAAVFSFTKSDWCYGGGLVAARSQEMIARAKSFREKFFQPSARLVVGYGLLRHADFVANRPERSHAAELAGQTLEKLFGFRADGFYAAGRFDARMPEFAARRAGRLLAASHVVLQRRRDIVEEIRNSLSPRSRVLSPREDGSHDSCAFLLVQGAVAWRERAARQGVTLRLCWPAYQDGEPAQDTTDVRWLAEHLLLVEIHPDLTGREVERIAQCLRNLEG